jgi:DNA-binding LacI/PurR family transcriptional regulator
MTTIKDVARRAGVSVSTVSRVLNGYAYVTDGMRRQVLEAIQELNYHPNRVAQRLRATDSRLVGVIFSDITNPFYINVLHGIELVFSQQDLSVLIGNANANPDLEASLVRLMQTEEVAGLIIAPTEEDAPALAHAAQDGLPIVVVDRRMNSIDLDTVLANNFKGVRQAIEHLIRLGHSRIGIVNGPLHLTSGRERYAGYLQAMSDAQLPIDATLARFGDYRQSSGYKLTCELLDLPHPPTALFVANNQMTIGALNAIHETGHLIPDEVAVVGFDDLSWAISLNPPLTTVAQPTFDIGTHAAQLLLDRISEPDHPTRTIVLETELIVRASCGSRLPQDERRTYRAT